MRSRDTPLMAGPGGDGPPARGLATIEMAEHHGKVMLLYALGKRYAEISRLTGYSWNGVRRIVITELAKRTMPGPVADLARGRADARLEVMIERLEEHLLADDESLPDMEVLDRYFKAISLQAIITIPKLPTKVDVLVGGDATAAIALGERLNRFMNMADVVVANRLGSGRAPEDVIDVEAVSSNGHG